MHSFFQDIRFGARLLVRQPGFTLAAVLALALGIGGSTAIFSAVHGVLLRPLPYPDSDRLVSVWETHPAVRIGSVSGPNFHDWSTQNTGFEALTAISFVDRNLTGEGEPERVSAAKVSSGFFRVFGVEPNVGRAFLPGEHAGEGSAVAVLDYRLWQRRFDADPEIIGKTVTIDGRPWVVVGVMPEQFRQIWPYPFVSVDLWTPLPADVERSNRGNHFLLVYGRLKPDVSVTQARSEMETIAHRIALEYPDVQGDRSVRVFAFKDFFIDGIRPALLILLGAVVLVLLIACANVAGLLLARGAARQGEFSLRLALGASRWRLVRQLLTEGLLLAMLGCGFGLLFALWGIDLLKAGLIGNLTPMMGVDLDGRIVALSVALAVGCGAFFAPWPAVGAIRGNLHDGLKEGAARTSSGPRRSRARRLLVVGEIAVSLVLLVGAGLMMRSFLSLSRVDLGFNAENLLTFRISLPDFKYDNPAKVAGFYTQLLDRLNDLPGVTRAAVVNYPPLGRGNMNGGFTIEGRPPWKKGEDPVTEYQVVSPDYFHTMGMRLVSGRQFSSDDVSGNRPVVIINQAMARRFWPDQNPVGERLRIGWAGDEFLQIVGVVADVKRWGLDDEAGSPESYVLHQRVSQANMVVVVRAAVDPPSLMSAIREQVRQVDPTQPLYDVKSMEEIVGESIADRRFSMVVLSIFAAIALVLAVVGIYGVMAFQVRQRTQEMGIRIALGAQAKDIFRLVLGEGARLTAWGLGLGLLGALVLGRVLRGLLYGVGESDPATVGGVLALLAVVALLATYVPARRASRTDPMVVLRAE